MGKQAQEPAAVKQTTPKGLEIPVPKRKDLQDDFEKRIQPVKKP
jgi:hypothetical protein